METFRCPVCKSKEVSYEIIEYFGVEIYCHSCLHFESHEISDEEVINMIPNWKNDSLKEESQHMNKFMF